MKTCITCGKEKPESRFYRHRGMKSGRLNKCDTCQKKQADEWRRNNPDRFNEMRRARELEKVFGITMKQYQKMLKDQGGVCAGCLRSPEQLPPTVGGRLTRYLAVDHDHSTGFIRGLLCSQCNLILGNANDNPETLQRLIAYLEEHEL